MPKQLSHTIGVDNGIRLSECAFQRLQTYEDQLYRRQKLEPRLKPILAADELPDCIIIEWIDEKTGIYSNSKYPPPRSRAANVLRTHSTGTSIRDELVKAGHTVCCVPRSVILQQAGWQKKQKADAWVLRHLEVLGYLKVSTRFKKSTLKPYYVCTTAGLTQTHDRDALMCSLFAWRDAQNARFIVRSVIR